MEEGIKCLKLWPGVIKFENLRKDERSNILHASSLQPR
jgi:hypothetical protein